MSTLRQNVNFYQLRFRERAVRLPAAMLLQTTAMVIATMLLLSSYAAYQVAGVQSDLELIAQQEHAAVKRLETLRTTIADVIGETSWAERLDVASTALAQKEASLRLIAGTELGDASGFARHLKSLARQTTTGLWLTNIALSARGDRIWLQGEALRADLVPTYLQNLADEEPFESQRFHRLEIDKATAEDARTVSFVVTSDESLDGKKALYQ
ncbi:MAG: PilN domain-containing protein [Woeseia sp.]